MKIQDEDFRIFEIVKPLQRYKCIWQNSYVGKSRSKM